MKVYFIIILSLFGLTGCAQTNQQKDTLAKKQKVLIVYLTRTNNTKAVAEMVQAKTGGDLVAIEPATLYSANYQQNVAEVAAQNNNGILPPLKNKIDISKYDVVFLGFPTWCMQLPPPVKTFLNDNNWSGKTIAPFNTNAGYGLGSSQQQIERYCSAGKITEIFSVEGGKERDGIMFVMEGKKETEVQAKVKDWLQKIKLIQ